MADVHDKKTRSYNMSQIKATNTKPELMVRNFFSFKRLSVYTAQERFFLQKPESQMSGRIVRRPNCKKRKFFNPAGASP
jgi:G:T-mismatch repair DNA endonuclease (very short patch repair protein)